MPVLAWGFLGAYCAVTLGIFFQLNRSVPDPYMDEVFHIPQARSYCEGNWTSWDSKITTPPGLYVSAVAYLRGLAMISRSDLTSTCTNALLRSTNLLFAFGNFWMFYYLRIEIMEQLLIKAASPEQASSHVDHKVLPSSLMAMVEALTLVQFPLLYFFNFLFYTDVPSVFFVMLTYLCSLRGQRMATFFSAAASVALRQTNVVWVLHSATVVVLVTKGDMLDSASGPFAFICACITLLRRSFCELLHRTSGQLIVLTGFLIYLYGNNGVVLGDRENHVVVLHLMQVAYLMTFIAGFDVMETWLLLLLRLELRTAMQRVAAKRRFWVGLGILTAFFCLAVWRFTHVHPFILADNRHYMFYVWRRIINYSSATPFLLVPVYVWSSVTVFGTLYAGLRSVKTWVFLAACFMATIPHALIEPRYFLIPYLLYRLQSPPRPFLGLISEMLFYIGINCFTLYMFILRPFGESSQRLMW